MVLGLIQWRPVIGLAAKDVGDQRDGSGTRLGSIALGDASGEVLVEVRGNSALKAARFIGDGEELIVDAIGEGEAAGDLPGICGIDLGLVVAVVALIAGQLRQHRALGVVVEVGRNSAMRPSRKVNAWS
jgi:hypothetical protein